MKNLFKIIFCTILLNLIGSQECLTWPFSKKTEPKNSKKESKVVAKMTILDSQSPEIIQLIEDSEVAINRLESNLAKKEQQLKAATDAKLAEIAQKLKSNLSSEALKIRQEATSQTLGIINETEAKALAVRQEKRLKSFSERFGIPFEPTRTIKADKSKAANLLTSRQSQNMLSSPQMITAELRNNLSRQFYDDMLFMKNIITGAENPNEIKDFEKRFMTQNKWFERTLKKASSVNDGHYLQLKEKQEKVHAVVEALKQADTMLFKMAHDLSSGQLDKARLMVLYDLNDSLKNKEENADDDEEVSLSKNDIEGVVKKVFAELSTKYKEREGDFPDVRILNNKTSPYIPVMAQQLQAQLMSVQGKLAKAEQLLAARKNFENTVLVKKLEQTTKHAMGLEIELKKANEASTFLQRGALGSSTLLFAKKLEDKERKILDLDILLRRVSQKADLSEQRSLALVGETSLLKARVASAEQNAQQQLALRKEAETKLSLDRRIAQQTIASINSYVQTLRAELQDVTNKLRLTEDILNKSKQEVSGQLERVQAERNALLARQASLTQDQGKLEQLRAETKRLVENSMRVNDSAIIGLKKNHEVEMRNMRAALEKELAFVRQSLTQMQGVKQAAVVPAPRKMVPVQQLAVNNPQNVAAVVQSVEEDEEDEE